MEWWRFVIFGGIILLLFGHAVDAQNNCKNGDKYGNKKMSKARITGAAPADGADDTVIVLDTGSPATDSVNPYEIDCCGYIDEWKYIVFKDEYISFQIFRPQAGGDYKLISSQEVDPEDTNKEKKIDHSGVQANVQPGDVIGWTGNALEYEDDTSGNPNYAVNIFKATSLAMTEGSDYTINTDNTPGTDRRNYALNVKFKKYDTLTCTITINTATIPGTTAANTVIGTALMDDPYLTMASRTVVTDPTYFDVAANGDISNKVLLPVDPTGGTTQDYTITIDLVDLCGNTVRCSGVQTVQMVNNAITITSLDATTNLIESTTAVKTVHTLVTTDIDRTITTDNPTCTITATTPAGAPFTCTVDGADPLTWYIKNTLNPGFDDVATPQYTITVTCSDVLGLTDTKVLTVDIDPNLQPVPTTAAATETVDAFSTPATTVVHGPITWTDPENDTVTLTLIKGSPTSPFALNPLTNEIYATSNLAFESTLTHSFTIQYSDGYNVVTSTLVITIDGANEKPAFPNTAIAVSIPETYEGGVNVSFAGVTDANLAEDSQTLNCTLNTISLGFSSYFEIISTNTGCAVTLKDTPDPTSVLDYESVVGGPVIVLEIAVNDGIDYAAANAFVTITVTDVNERPVFADATQTIYLVEEVTTPMVLTDFNTAVTDPDAGDTKTYSIASGNDDGFFSIDPATGALSLAVFCDREYNCSSAYDLVIHCTDSGGLVGWTDVKVFINDTNDHNPSCTPDSTIYVTNTTLVSYLLAQVRCTDRDSTTLNSNTTIRIVGTGLGTNYFSYADGNIELKKQWDRPTNFQFKFSVCAEDTGTPTLSGCATITVNPQPTITTTARVYPQLGFFDTEGGVAIFTMCMGCAFGLLLCAAAVYLRKSSCERCRWPCKSRPKKKKVPTATLR